MIPINRMKILVPFLSLLLAGSNAVAAVASCRTSPSENDSRTHAIAAATPMPIHIA